MVSVGIGVLLHRQALDKNLALTDLELQVTAMTRMSGINA
jgi:hypothetical protein